MARARLVSSIQPMIQTLEPRQLLAATPAHLALGQRSVAETLPENNVYSNSTPVVTWDGIAGKTVTTNSSDCTTYWTVALRTAYGITNSQLNAWTGSSLSSTSQGSPNLNMYYDAALADSGFEHYTNITDWEAGDLFICDYPTGSSARGHMVVLEQQPYQRSFSADGTQRYYTATIIDVTGAVHSSDTRNRIDPSTGDTDTGVGRGNITLITDLRGELLGWKWGTGSGSSTYLPNPADATKDYHSLFAKFPGRTNSIAFDPTNNLNVKVEFSNDMDLATIAAGDLKVTNTTTGTTFVPTGVTLSADLRTATFTLPATVTDGDYKFTLAGSSVKTVKGNTLATSGTLSGTGVYILPGDANRDRKVDFDDLLILSQNYGKTGQTFAQGNFNYSTDGLVDFGDLLILAQRYGKTMLTTASFSATPIAETTKSGTAAKPRGSLVADVL